MFILIPVIKAWLTDWLTDWLAGLYRPRVISTFIYSFSLDWKYIAQYNQTLDPATVVHG